MKSFRQFLSEAITRDDLIAHYNEQHGGIIERRSKDHEWNEHTQEKYNGGFRSHINSFYPHRLDPQKLATLPGRNGEHLHVGKQDSAWNHEFEQVKSSIKKNGFQEKIPEHDYESGAMIRVFHNGDAKIHEGNKRTRAAAQLGHRTVPVRWEWQGNSAWDRDAPHPVDFMHDDDLRAMRMKIRAKRLGINNDT